MSLFPDAADLAIEPYAWRPRFKTFVAGPFGNENIVTRAGIQFPLHSATLRYELKGWDPTIRAVYEFWNEMKGRYQSFSFYDLQGWDSTPVGIAWGNYTATVKGLVYVATQVTAGITTFDLPARYTDQPAVDADTSKHVLVNGTGVTVNSWTWNTGTDGRTRVVLASAPSLGDVITCTFTARRVWKAMFAEDEPQLEWASADAYTLSVDLVEVP